MSANSRLDWICRAVLVLVCLAMWAPRSAGPINFRWDASTYYILGTALAEGKGYRLLNEPGEIQAVQYPPLLPMIVALHQRIMGTSDYFKVGSALRHTYFILSAIFLLLAYQLARTLFSPACALLIATITALSLSAFVLPSDVLYAEMPFAAVAMGFALCQQRSHSAFFAAATGMCGVVAFLLRTAGLALLLAWIAESLIRRRFRQAILRIAVSVLPVLLWQCYVWKVTTSYNYRHPTYAYQRANYYYSNVSYSTNNQLVDPFRPELGQVRLLDLGERVGRNLMAIPVALSDSAVIPSWRAPALLQQLHRNLGVPVSSGGRSVVTVALHCVSFCVGFLALIGATMVARSRNWFLALYFLITLAMIVMTPWQNQFWRYLAPMAPLTLMFFFLVLITVRQRLRKFQPKWEYLVGSVTLGVPSAVILLMQSSVVVHLFRSMDSVSYYDRNGSERALKLIDYEREWHALDPAFEWIRRNAGEGVVLATSVPHLAYLRTGCKAVLLPFESNPAAMTDLLDDVPVTYLVLDQFDLPGISRRYAAPMVVKSPQNWRLVFTAPDDVTRVYERIH